MQRLLLFLIAALSAFGQTLPGHYIVELTEAPLAEARSARSERKAAIVRQQTRVRQAITAASGEIQDAFDTTLNGLAAKMTADQAEALKQQPGVKSVRQVRLYRPLLDRALPLQGIVDAWQQLGGSANAGAGIKIGVIDTGIDSAHPGFQSATMTAPAGFPKMNRDSDRDYTNGKIIVARAYTDPSTGKAYPATDTRGHGTAVAMIAAGLPNQGTYGVISGIAPAAFLGNYRVFPPSGSASDAVIIRAIEDAVDDGMDVITLSLGSFPATRPSDDSLAIAVERAVGLGKIVTVAAGNEGPDPNTISSPATAPSAIAVGSVHNDRIYASHVLAEGRDPMVALAGTGPTPGAAVGGVLADIAQFDPQSLGCSSYPSGALAGKIALIQRGTCTFEVKINNAAAAGAIGVVIYMRDTAPDAIVMNVGAATLPALSVSYADGSALRDASRAADITASLDFVLTASSVDPNRLSDFSSVGPGADLSIKPDVVAIGHDVSTAAPVDSGSWTVLDGTSFSAPMAAGVAAMMLAARPGLSMDQYRSLIINSATPVVQADGSTAGVESVGVGRINALGAIASPITVNPVSLSFGEGGVAATSMRTLTIRNNGATADTFTIAVQPNGTAFLPDISSNTVALDPGQTATVAVTIPLSGMGPGVYQGVLAIQGTQPQAFSRVAYWYGVPSQKPRYFQLISSPTQVRAGSTFDVVFRLLDSNGLPVTSGVSKSILTGATVMSLGSADSQVPGALYMVVAAGTVRGTLTLQFTADGVPPIAPISISVR